MVNLSPDRRLAVAWVVVVTVTLIYLVIDGSVDDRGLDASPAASVLAIGLALAKLRIIMREFMDVRRAPKMLRHMTDALVVSMGVLLLGTYLVGRTVA
jgi:hypothetical protein